MITNAKNKIVGELQEFHFAGGGEYLPQTIRASTREEAEKKWIETRVPVGKEKESKEIIN